MKSVIAPGIVLLLLMSTSLAIFPQLQPVKELSLKELQYHFFDSIAFNYPSVIEDDNLPALQVKEINEAEAGLRPILMLVLGGFQIGRESHRNEQGLIGGENLLQAKIGENHVPETLVSSSSEDKSENSYMNNSDGRPFYLKVPRISNCTSVLWGFMWKGLLEQKTNINRDSNTSALSTQTLWHSSETKITSDPACNRLRPFYSYENSPLALNSTFPIHRSAARKLYANVDWTQPQYYNTTRAVAVGTKLYYFSRGVDGVFLSEYDTMGGTWTNLPQYNWLTDAEGWSAESHYSTIRLATVGSKIYIYGRSSQNATLASYDTSNSTWTQLPSFAFLRDADGCSVPMCYSTIRMAVVDSSLYITARCNYYINIATFNTSTLEWTSLPSLDEFTDSIWNQYMYYVSFSLVAMPTNLYLFGRGPSYIYLVRFNITSRTWDLSRRYSQYTDREGWNDPSLYETVQVATKNAAIFIGSRYSSGFQMTYYYPATDNYSTPPQSLSAFASTSGWTKPQYYRTIQLMYSDKKLYVIGRGPNGLYSGVSAGFGYSWSTLPHTSAFLDRDGWDQEHTYSTIHFLGIGNQLYVVGRNLAQLQLSIYNISESIWSSEPSSYFPCYNVCKECSGSLFSSCIECFSLAELVSPAPSVCRCIHGSFPNPDASNCTRCDATCQECSEVTSSSCTACYPNASLQTSLPSSCVCDQGFYPNMTVSACTECDPTCFSCSGPLSSQCTACYLYSVLLGPSPNVCGCSTHSYLLVPTTGLCLACDSSCLECDGSSRYDCTSCHAHATLQEDKSCTCSATHYFNSSTGLCSECFKSCLTCSNSERTQCTACFTGASLLDTAPSSCKCNHDFYPNPDASSCSQCDSTCKECNEKAPSNCTVCFLHASLQTPPTSHCECDQGFYPNSTVSSCAKCHITCFRCSGPSATHCTDCYPTSTLLGASPNACQCSSGYFLIIPEQGLCSKCDVTCRSCNWSNQLSCTSCRENAVLQSVNSCECSDTYYMIRATGSCAACHKSCLTCRNSEETQCTTCFAGASLLDAAPSSCKCNSGFFPNPDASKCTRCDRTCQECSGNTVYMCTQCYPNATLENPPTSQCVCKKSFYTDSTVDACTKCDSSCLRCSGPSPSNCTVCNGNFTFIGSDKKVCGCLPGAYILDPIQGHCSVSDFTFSIRTLMWLNVIFREKFIKPLLKCLYSV